MKSIIFFVLLLNFIAACDTIDLALSKTRKDSIKSKMELLQIKKDKLKDSVIIIKNKFEYIGQIYTSEIKHKIFGNYEITYYYKNHKKWIKFTVIPYQDIDYMSEKIIEPVYEWDTNGKLLNTGKDNLSISNKTFNFFGHTCYGLCSDAALSGSLTGKIILNPDSAITVKLFSVIEIDIDSTYKANARTISWWVKYPDNSGWKLSETFNHQKYSVPSSKFTLGQYYNKPIGIYIQYDSKVKSNGIPNNNSMPTLTIIKYNDGSMLYN